MKKYSAKSLVLVLVAFLLVLSWIFLPELIPGRGPIWRGIAIGISTQADVINALGQPSSLEKGILTTTFAYDEKGMTKGTHYIVIRFGVVQKIEEDTLVYSEYIKLKSLIEEHGLPNIVEWSLEGPDRRMLIFNDGIMANVVVSPLDEAVVTKIIYFKPMSSVLLRLKFVNMFSSVDPFPNSDIVGQKDPWFGTSNACRSICE